MNSRLKFKGLTHNQKLSENKFVATRNGLFQRFKQYVDHHDVKVNSLTVIADKGAMKHLNKSFSFNY